MNWCKNSVKKNRPYVAKLFFIYTYLVPFAQNYSLTNIYLFLFNKILMSPDFVLNISGNYSYICIDNHENMINMDIFFQ